MTFTEIDQKNPDIIHTFCFLNETLLNNANPDINVNLRMYEEYNTKAGKLQRFSRITDFTITEENVYIPEARRPVSLEDRELNLQHS